MLKIKNISKSFGNSLIIPNFSAELQTGKIIGFLGPNGAGKTTIIRMLVQILQPDSGQIFFENSIFERKHLGKIGYMPEEKGLYPNMQVKDQLLYLGKLHGINEVELLKSIDEWLEKFDMTQYATKKVSQLSKGNAQKIQFISTVLHNPDFIILDEPLSGLDPVNAQLINQSILEFHNAGKTVLFSTHRMEQAEELCDQVIFLNKGEKIIDDTPMNLKYQYQNNEIEIGFSKNEELVNGLKTEFSELIISTTPNVVIMKMQDSKTLSSLMGYISLHNFDVDYIKKRLPTLNEIFIKLVK
jgi:ABC-2 type transport system ATP-binding protein